jgi:hypothetical protein
MKRIFINISTICLSSGCKKPSSLASENTGIFSVLILKDFQSGVHVCNPSFFEGGSRRVMCSKPDWAQSYQDPVSKTKNTKGLGACLKQ